MRQTVVCLTDSRRTKESKQLKSQYESVLGMVILTNQKIYLSYFIEKYIVDFSFTSLLYSNENLITSLFVLQM